MSLTIICFGRNDNFHDDYVERTNSCLLYNLRSIDQADLLGSIKFLFVDYGSSSPLSQSFIFPKEYSQSINVLTLSPDDLDGMGRHGPFLPYGFILSYASRFVDTRFLFWGASDVVGLPDSFSKLHRYCELQTLKESPFLLVTERIFLNRNFFRWPRSFEEVDFYLQAGVCEPQHISGCGGGGSYIGSSVSALRTFGGIALETLPPGRTEPDIELFIRSLEATHPTNVSRVTGAYFYKFPYSPGGNRAWIIKRAQDTWMGDLVGSRPSPLGCAANRGVLQKPLLIEGDIVDRKFRLREGSKNHDIFPILSATLRSYSCLKHLGQILSIVKLLKVRDIRSVVLVGDFHYSIPLACSAALGFGVIYWFYGDRSRLSMPTFMIYSRSESTRSRVSKDPSAFHGLIRVAPLGRDILISSAELGFMGGNPITLIASRDGKLFTKQINFEVTKDSTLINQLCESLTSTDRITSVTANIQTIFAALYFLLLNVINQKING